MTSALDLEGPHTILPEKAFVFRFADHHFTVPVRGGLRRSELTGSENLSYAREGECITLSDSNGASMKLTVLSLESLALSLKVKTSKGDLEMHFERIDDSAVSILQQADRD